MICPYCGEFLSDSNLGMKDGRYIHLNCVPVKAESAATRIKQDVSVEEKKLQGYFLGLDVDSLDFSKLSSIDLEFLSELEKTGTDIDGIKTGKRL